MYPTTNLQPGMSGSEVKKLQDFLVSQGFMTTSQVQTGPGIYGPQTTDAVLSYQKSLGIDYSSGPGYWGPKTIAATSGQTSNQSRNMNFSPKIGDPIPNSNLKYEAEDISNLQNINKNTNTINKDTTSTEKHVESVIESIISSGKTINPNLTIEDLAGITPEEFMRQAELAISPQYKEQFQTIKDNLSRELTNIGYDLNLKKEDITRKSAETLNQGNEELAGRGMAFSGKREQFIGDVAGARTRDEEAARTLAFRESQGLGSVAESRVGTSALLGSNLPQIEGRSPFQFSSTPLTGSDVYSQRTGISNYAQGLEGRTRDLRTQYPDTNRAQITRALGFA